MSVVGLLETFRTRVESKVGEVDSPKLDPSNDVLDLCIDAGLNQYTRLRPRYIVKEIAGDGTTKRYVLNNDLSVWEPSFSTIIKISRVLNRNTDSETETFLDNCDYTMKQDTSGNDILFLDDVVSASAFLRIKYSGAHVIDDTVEANTTVPDIDTDLLTTLCAAYVAFWIARKASDLSNVSLGSSEVSYWRLRQHWGERAKELMKEASEFINPKMIASSGAGIATEWSSISRLAPRRISH